MGAVSVLVCAMADVRMPTSAWFKAGLHVMLGWRYRGA